MKFKKAIVATLVVSGMLAALAGPIPAGAEAAQEQQHIKQYAGKEIKLKNVGEKIEFSLSAKVESVDGKYAISFHIDGGKIWEVSEKITIDKISKEDQEKILKVLKKAYANKTYEFNKEVIMHRGYDGEKEKLGVNLSYELTGEDFNIFFLKENSAKEHKGRVGGFEIKFTKEELDPKLLETATKAVKTAFNHDLEVTAANLRQIFWTLEDKYVSLEIVKGEVTSLYHKSRKAVTTNKEITEKDAKEVVAPLAKELFNIDISEYEVKWDNLFKDYCFVKGKATEVRAALDAEKNVVYIKSGSRAAAGN
ncbi:MAG: hypothetical protein E6230_28640 [Paenibacillus dendritiformis]|nr:hypothetical protein [Paenibacillus dendritiformis]